MNLDEYAFFSIVRNPFDRMVSEYFHIKNNDWATEYKNLSFDNFVVKSINTEIEKRIKIFDAHIEPQYNFVKSKRFIKIFKYEKLKEAFNWIEKKVKKRLIFGHERKTNRGCYQCFFTSQEVKTLMFDFYKDDFCKFNYSFEEFAIEYEI